VVMRDADASTLALVEEQTSVHTKAVQSVGFSPDGTRIVSGSDDLSINVWHWMVSAPRLMLNNTIVDRVSAHGLKAV